jgi:4-hydroxy-tetrahydrodipicolinate synthase
MHHPLPKGIVGVVQTPFLADGSLDEGSLARLVESAIASGIDGFLAPAVASEVESLTPAERERILHVICEVNSGRVPLIVGASASGPDECVAHGRLAEDCDAAAILVAVPSELYSRPERIIDFFASIAGRLGCPLIVQDLDWNGPGLEMTLIRELAARIPTLAGMKIETVPAGPKYTQVREALGNDFYLAGGWAVPQMIEALDRGVDALIPECSMIPVYTRIDRMHRAGDREVAQRTFRELLPVLAYTNQEIRTSIAFFKELLVRKGIFRTAHLRGHPFAWDSYNRKVADELIDLYLQLEQRIGVGAGDSTG